MEKLIASMLLSIAVSTFGGTTLLAVILIVGMNLFWIESKNIEAANKE